MMKLPRGTHLCKPVTRYSVQSTGKVFRVIIEWNVYLRPFTSTLNVVQCLLLCSCISKVCLLSYIRIRILFEFCQARSLDAPKKVNLRWSRFIEIDTNGEKPSTVDSSPFFIRIMYLFQNHPTWWVVYGGSRGTAVDCVAVLQPRFRKLCILRKLLRIPLTSSFS